MGEITYSGTYQSPFSLRSKVARLIWQTVWFALGLALPIYGFAIRRVVLRCFGAKIGPRVRVYPSCTIWAPWKLEMGAESSMGPGVDCYNVAPITLGSKTVVSQRAFLCTASHNIRSADFDLIYSAIIISDGAWIAAEAFIGPGVRVANDAIVGARTVVIRDVAARDIVVGNPQRIVGKR